MIQSFWKRYFGGEPDPTPAPAPRAARPLPSPRAVAGGRVSMDKDGEFAFGANWIMTAPEDYEDEWRLGNFDANTLSKVSATRLAEILFDLSPEVNRAGWDFMRMCNPGWEFKAFRPGSTTEFPKARKALDEFIKVLDTEHGSFNVLVGRFYMAAFLRGAMAGELVTDAAGRVPLDIASPDPMAFRFRKRKDPVRGTVYELGQWQNGEWVSLELPTIAYIPIDPALNSPYGRPMISPALFTSLFLLAMLHDLKRVVQQQGYPRFDVSVDFQQLADTMPAEAIGNPTKAQEWTNAIIDMVMRAYAQLQPDDAYVHSSSITVNKPVGAVDASSLGAVDALIKALERMATRALKTMPLMMGLDQSTNETDSNRQWEIFAAGIKSIQHYCESLLERLFTLALECQGIAATVEFRFAELRAAEELRDEQTRTMRINNSRAEYDHGWISQDEAAQKGAGKDKADQPRPRNVQATQNQPVQDDGDGQERNDRLHMIAVMERMEQLVNWWDEKVREEEDTALRMEQQRDDIYERTNGKH